MKMIWSNDGAIWSIDGILQAQSSLSDCVPKDIPIHFQFYFTNMVGMVRPAAVNEPQK
jgi:hypothetical protein